MAVVGVTLINGTAYTHADITTNILGQPFIEITEISYSDPQDIELNYGAQNEPTSRGYGAINPTASVTMAKKDVDVLRAAAPGRRIQNIPDFDIGVNFATEAGDFTRDRLTRCRFKGQDVTSSQGNTNILITLELSVANISYGID